jgi:hypothetical protein
MLGCVDKLIEDAIDDWRSSNFRQDFRSRPDSWGPNQAKDGTM